MINNWKNYEINKWYLTTMPLVETDVIIDCFQDLIFYEPISKTR